MVYTLFNCTLFLTYLHSEILDQCHVTTRFKVKVCDFSEQTY